MMVYEAFNTALLAGGTDTIFGLMGDANMLYLAEFQDRGGRFVPVVHEASAVAAADAWSRVTGRVGVASVTHGPAVTNTMTSLVEAVRSRSRVLLLTGDTPPVPTHFQRLDLAGLASAAGAGYEKVYKPTTVARDLGRAMQRVVAEDRPVLLDLPIGMVRQEVATQAPVAPVRTRATGTPEAVDLDAALGILATARRPIVLAGRGAVLAGAREELVALADRLGAPLATTVLAKDLFRGHPSNIGIFGNLSHGAAALAISEADCVVAFGASLNVYTSGGGKLLRGKKVVQVDVDPGAFGWSASVDEAVSGDAKAAARLMREALAAAGLQPTHGWLQRTQQAVARHDLADDFQDRSAEDTVDVRTAMLRLNDLLPERRVLVSDIGRFVLGVWPYLEVTDPLEFTTMGGFGSIGLGLAGAIGAAVARSGSATVPTVAVVGDGGFMMSLPELATAVRERLPLIVVVLDDGAYGAEHYKLVHFGANADYSLNTWPDLVTVAQAMGAGGMTVRQVADLETLPARLADHDGPFLLDVKLDPHVNILD